MLAGCTDRGARPDDRASDAFPAWDTAIADQIDESAFSPSSPDSAESTAPSAGQASVVIAPKHWPADVHASGRRPTSVRLRARWSYAASWDDTTILQPTHAAVVERAVIVQDMGHMALFGLQREAGTLRWRQGRRGSGPGEFQYGEITRASDTSVYFFDGSLRRLTEWSDAGQLLDSRALPRIGTIRGLCRANDGHLYVSVRPHDKERFIGLARLPSDADSLVDRRPLPLDRPIHRTAMDAQMPIYPLGDGSCALGAAHESWLALFSSIDAMHRVTLMEEVPPPILVDTKIDTKFGEGVRTSFAGVPLSGVRGIARLGNVIAVAFGGHTSARRRLVDFYHRDPWRYEGSIVLPGTIRTISARDSTFVIVSEDTTGFGRIDAFTVDVSRVR